MKIILVLVMCVMLVTPTGNEDVPCKEYPLTTVVTETGTDRIFL